MLKVELAPLVTLLLLIATPTVADGIRELDRCELEISGLSPRTTVARPITGKHQRSSWGGSTEPALCAAQPLPPMESL